MCFSVKYPYVYKKGGSVQSAGHYSELNPTVWSGPWTKAEVPYLTCLAMEYHKVRCWARFWGRRCAVHKVSVRLIFITSVLLGCRCFITFIAIFGWAKPCWWFLLGSEVKAIVELVLPHPVTDLSDLFKLFSSLMAFHHVKQVCLSFLE